MVKKKKVLRRDFGVVIVIYYKKKTRKNHIKQYMICGKIIFSLKANYG